MHSSKAISSKGDATKDDVTCDDSIDGLAFCASDADVVFCSDGAWWTLSCPAIDELSFCGVELGPTGDLLPFLDAGWRSPE